MLGINRSKACLYILRKYLVTMATFKMCQSGEHDRWEIIFWLCCWLLVLRYWFVYARVTSSGAMGHESVTW